MSGQVISIDPDTLRKLIVEEIMDAVGITPSFSVLLEHQTGSVSIQDAEAIASSVVGRIISDDDGVQL